MTPHLTITVSRTTFAVAGMSTAASGASAIILAICGAALLVDFGIYLATSDSQLLKTWLANAEGKILRDQARTLIRLPR